MKIMNRLLLIILALCIIGCAFSEKQADSIRTNSLTLGLCSIHKIPLTVTKGYRSTEIIFLDYHQSVYAGLRRFPNAFPLTIARCKSPDFSNPVAVRYCIKCEESLNSYLKDHLPHS